MKRNLTCSHCHRFWVFFPQISVHFGEEFLELNLGSAQDANSKDFLGLPAVLSIVTGQADVSSHHKKDNYNNSHRFTTAFVSVMANNT